MSDKPSYLGLLNAVSLGESRAHAYLSAWADVTPSDEVRAVLRTVAAREGEHGMTFAKRINELGYHLRQKDDPNFAKQLEVARSSRSDLEKMEKLGVGRLDTGDRPDVFDDFFKDHSIDIRTGEMLGRYICEERDSARLLRQCYELLKAADAESQAAASNGNGKGKDKSSAAVKAQLDGLETKVDAICQAVEDLRQIVCATIPAATAS